MCLRRRQKVGGRADAEQLLEGRERAVAEVRRAVEDAEQCRRVEAVAAEGRVDRQHWRHGVDRADGTAAQLDRVGGDEAAHPAHDADALVVAGRFRHLADATGPGHRIEAVEEYRPGVRRVDDAGIRARHRVDQRRVVRDAARRPLGAAVTGRAVGGAEDRAAVGRIAAGAGRRDGAADGGDEGGDVLLLRRAVGAGGTEVAHVGVGVGRDPVGVDVGIGGDETAAAENAAGVELEVLVLVAHRAPVEGAVVGQVEFVEGAVERDGLARASLERPGDVVGAAVRMARGAAAPATVGPEGPRGEEVDLAAADLFEVRIGRQFGRTGVLHDGVVYQVGDDDVARRRTDDVSDAPCRIEGDAAWIATRLERIGRVDRKDASDRADRERTRRRRRVDRRLAVGVEGHADDEVAALAHHPAGVGVFRAVDVDRHRGEEPFGVVADLRVQQAGGQVEVDAAIQVERLIGDLLVGRDIEDRDQALHVGVEAQRRLRRGGGVGHEAAFAEQRDALQQVREGAGGLRLGTVGAAVGEDGARRVTGGGVDERAAREVEARVDGRQDDLPDHRVGRGGDDVDHPFT